MRGRRGIPDETEDGLVIKRQRESLILGSDKRTWTDLDES